MTEYLTELFRASVSQITLAVIYLYPMWKMRSVRTRTIVIYLIGFFLLLSLTQAASMFFFDLDPMPLSLVPSLVPCVAPFFMFRKKGWQIVFLLAVAFMYATVVGAGRYISEYWLAGSQPFLADIIGIIVIAVTLPPLLITLKRLYRNPDMMQAVLFWRLAWLIPALFFLIIFLTSSWPSGNINANFLTVRVLIYAVLLIICRLFEIVVRQITEAEGVKRREQIVSAENANLERLNRIKTDFLHDMNHELRTPLAIITTGITFAEGEMGLGGNAEKARGALHDARSEAMRIGRMLDGMADMADMAEIVENRQRLDFAVLLRESAEAFRLRLLTQKVDLRVDLPGTMPDVYVEADKLTRVMGNLLSNAADHTAEGMVTVTAEYDAAYITVCVADTGNGIPPELLPHVFERGVSGRGGTGYGLSICKSIIEAHGGTIEAASDSSGTAMTFTVPVYGGQEAGHKA